MSAFKTAMKERRYAKFFIGQEAIRENPDLVVEILSKVLVMRAEFSMCRDGMMYEACSPVFDPVPENQVPTQLRVVRRPLGGMPNMFELQFRAIDYVETV